MKVVIAIVLLLISTPSVAQPECAPALRQLTAMAYRLKIRPAPQGRQVEIPITLCDGRTYDPRDFVRAVNAALDRLEKLERGQ